MKLKSNLKRQKNIEKKIYHLENNQSATHPQAIYTSRLLNPFTKDLLKYENSECLDCVITD
jgi:hypothetical protein